MGRFTTWMVVVVGGLLLTSPAAVGAPAGAEELAAALVQKHAYLLTDGERGQLDEINRDLRVAKEALESADGPDDRREAAQRYEQAAGRLLATLEQLDCTIRITFRDGKVSISRGVDEPIAFPGDTGGMLFRVDAGDGGTRCLSLIEDLSRNSDAIVPMNIEPRGTTWALVHLDRVPALRTAVNLDLKPGNADAVRSPIFVVTPESGYIRVRVISDDTGEAAPAMVRMIWKTDGTDRRPSNAIEFATQFDSQGHASGRRNAILPGSLAGYYWCVPGPFDMSLPPGEWEITVRRGVEHIPVVETFTVRSGETVEKEYRPRRWVDMRRHGWYSGDDHVHSQILSDYDADRLMAWVQAEDIHLANVVKMGDIHRTWFEQRGFGPFFRVIDGDYVLSPGQECPRTHQQIGHTLSMNITSMVRDTDKYYLYDWVFDSVHAQGGLSGYAHVLMDLFFVHRDMSINIPKGKVDFVELMQFGKLGTELFYEFLNLGFKVTASAGSDVPWGGTIGEERVYAYVGEETFSADVWFEALRGGRTFVTSGPMLDLRVDDAMPGGEIRLDEGRKLRVRARAWGDPDRMVPSTLEIVRHGEVIESAKQDGTESTELALDFEIDAGKGFWLAARAEGSDGTKAHTTPVYVTVEPFRFWKHEGIQDQIDQRIESLKEIETIVDEARVAVSEDKPGLDRPQRQLAAQGDALLERVDDARGIYEALRKTAEEEGKAR